MRATAAATSSTALARVALASADATCSLAHRTAPATRSAAALVAAAAVVRVDAASASACVAAGRVAQRVLWRSISYPYRVCSVYTVVQRPSCVWSVTRHPTPAPGPARTPRFLVIVLRSAYCICATVKCNRARLSSIVQLYALLCYKFTAVWNDQMYST